MPPNDRTTPCLHALSIYSSESVLLDAVREHSMPALRGGDAVVLVATPGHLASMRAAIACEGIDVAAAERDDRLLVHDAQDLLDRFLVDGWPDEARFRAALAPLVARARGPHGRSVRAFGEMVVLLWSRHAYAATLELERIWDRYCAEVGVELLCAYPRSIFPARSRETIAEIARTHSQLVSG